MKNLRRYPQQHAVLLLLLAPPCSPRRTSWNPRGTLVEPSWNPGRILVEPWWNPRGTVISRTAPHPSGFCRWGRYMGTQEPPLATFQFTEPPRNPRRAFAQRSWNPGGTLRKLFLGAAPLITPEPGLRPHGSRRCWGIKNGNQQPNQPKLAGSQPSPRVFRF